MIIGHSETQPAADPIGFHVAVVTGTGLEALMELSLASAGDRTALAAPVRAALDLLGDTTGDTWLHLLGLCLDLPQPATTPDLIGRIEEMDPLQFRRTMLGRTAWSWQTLVGEATIDAATEGDEGAQATLLDHPRYYGGQARRALSGVISLDAETTQGRFLDALSAYHENVLAGQESDLERALTRLGATARRLIASKGWQSAIDTLTGGYRYIPEPEAERVVLMPHVADAGWLCLAQHNSARLIVYGREPDVDPEARLLRLGRALSEESRLSILRHLAGGPATLGSLIDATGLARSTVHHHLAELRTAGLIRFEGNARSYRYSIRPDAVSELSSALTEMLGLETIPTTERTTS